MEGQAMLLSKKSPFPALTLGKGSSKKGGDRSQPGKELGHLWQNHACLSQCAGTHFSLWKLDL